VNARKWIDQYADDLGEPIMVLGDAGSDQFDEALVGICHRFGKPSVALYDREKVIEILAKDMTWEEAVEWFDFNIIGAWLGDYTPVYMDSPPQDEGGEEFSSGISESACPGDTEGLI